MEKQGNSEMAGQLNSGSQKDVSDTDNSQSMSDTEAYTSNDEGGGSPIKKKKKKHRHRKKNVDSESSGDEGGGKKKRKKKKKKKRKKKKRDGSETEDTDDDNNNDDNNGARGGGASATDVDSDGPQITKRAPKKVNRSSLRTDPADWSKEDLMDKVKKFANFTVDKKSGAASLIISEKKILDESLKVLTELFNRNTEIKTITITKCFLVDDTFTQLMERGVMRQRHVHNLNLSGNALTNKSMQRIMNYYRDRDERPLYNLDVRDNILNAHDARVIYETLPRLTHFNGINLVESKQKIDLNLSSQKLKLTEVSIVCCLTRESEIIKKLDLSKNYVDSDSLHVLADMISHTEDIEAINLALNPLSNNGADNSGSLALLKAMQNSKVVVQIDVLGGNLRPDIEENLLRSVMVNRSIKGNAVNSNKFKDYLDKRFLEVAPEKPVYHLDGWMPSLKVDPAFLYSRQNAARNRQVEVQNDHIMLPRR